MASRPWKVKRCNRFSDNGQPLCLEGIVGCNRSSIACAYIHPDEPEWDSHRRPRVFSSLEWHHSPPEASSNAHRRGWKQKSQTSHRRASDHESNRASERKSFTQHVDVDPFSSPTIPAFPIPPSASPTTPLDQNVPEIPILSSPSAEPINEGKLGPWTERIMQIEDSVYARTVHKKDVKAVRDFKRLKQSWRYSYLNEDDKDRLNMMLAQLELSCENRRKQLNSAFMRLIQPDSGVAGESKRDRLNHQIAEIHGTFTKVQETFNMFIRGKYPECELQYKSGVALEQVQAPRTIDHSDRSIEDMPPLEYSPTDPNLLTASWDNFQIFKSRLSDFEDSVRCQYLDLADGVDAQIEAKLEDASFATSPCSSEGQRDDSGMSTHQIFTHLHDMERRAKHGSEQVGQISKEVHGLQMQADSSGTVLASMTAEIELAEHSNAAVRQKMNALAEEIKQNRKNIRALSAAHSSRKTARAQRKRRSYDIPSEYIVQALEMPLLDSVHTNVQSIIQGLNIGVIEMLRINHANVYDTVWPKLSHTLQVVDSLTAMVAQKDPKLE